MDEDAGGYEMSLSTGYGTEGRNLGLDSRYPGEVNRFFVGLVVEVTGRNAEGFYTTAATRYDIRASFPDSMGTVLIRGQVPSVRLWPSGQYLDADKLLGTHVIGVMLGNVVRWVFYEPPLVEECSTAPAPAPVSIGGAGMGTSVVPGGGPSSPSPSPTPTPAPGGEI